MIIILILAMCIGFGILKRITKDITEEERTYRLSNALTKLMFIAPIIVVIIFTILFITVLAGRFEERSSHALIVFMAWIYATAYYVEGIKHYKNKRLMISSMIGAVIALSTAFVLTPLDRYCNLLFINIHKFSYILGVVMFLVLYSSLIIFKKNNN